MLAILSLLISVSLDMLSPMLTMHIIDDVIIGSDLALLPYLLGGILCVGVGRCIFQYTKEYTFDKVGSKIASEMRKELFDHIQSLSCNFFDKNNTGELMARVKDDIDRIWNTMSYVGMLVIEVIYHTTVVLFCMYSLNVTLAIIPTCAMILCGFIAVIMERKLGEIYEEISEENAKLNTVAEENLAGVRTVKAFARERFEIKKFLSHNKRYYDLNMQQSKVFVRYYPFFQIITKLLPLLILLLGGRLVMKDIITLGALGAFIEYSNNIVWPMEMLGWLTNDLSAGIASNKKIQKIYNEIPAITEPDTPVILDTVKGKVEFSHVSFHKEDNHEILHDISFTVKPGKTIGIMGATGAGKTSVIQLLQRLYDATDGKILLDVYSVIDFCWGFGCVSLWYTGIVILGVEKVSVGTLIAFGTYISMFWQPIMNLSNFYNQLITNISGAERIFEILDTKSDITDAENVIQMPAINGSVDFEHVSFSYDENTNVLQDVSFHINPGETIALVGPTGAGKSTIVNLISRFYDIQEGTIRIDGHDIKSVSIESLRNQMGIMTQDNFLFTGTIRENIAYGKLDATEEEIIAAAKAVHAHDFIMKLPKQYDTFLEERGGGLSVGQKQLLAFARTMVSMPKILILDEATSSIDTKTELLVQEGIEALLKGRTSFVIAHRLSTIQKADRIFVIDNGGIMEEGNHEGLMAKRGAYYQLQTAQLQDVI